MANNTFRMFRRDVGAGDAGSANQGLASDPLAELARLIGQNEAYGGRRPVFESTAEDAVERNVPAAALDWTAEDEYAADDRGGDRSYLPRSVDSYATDSPEELNDWPRDPNKAEEPAAARQFFSALAGTRADARHGPADAYYRDEAEPAEAAPMPYVGAASSEYLTAERDSSDPGNHGEQEYSEEAHPRRSGPVLIIAMLGLAVLGSASAFGYHAMFGGSLILSLPPIIKPGNTPVKIVPKRETQAGAPDQAAPGASGPADKLVPHAEKPVDVQSANPTPHVVTTIPVIINTPGAPPPAAAAPAISPPATALAMPPPTMPAAGASGAVPAGASDQLSGPATATPPVGSKPVHTVIIKPQAPTQAVAKPPVATPATAHPARTRSAQSKPNTEPRSASAGPLSIVPNRDREGRPPAQGAHMAMARSSAPISPAGGSAEAVPAHGGYHVQVSSQRSEAEALAAFRSLQAKYPQQLGNRRAIVRRADLGSKGVFYRALVGPFASSEQAVTLCSSLKAAGGSCLIERN